MSETMTHSHSAEERRTRIETAALYRLVEYFRWSDLTDGYVVSRPTDDPDHMLVYSHGERPAEVRASRLHKVRVDGAFRQGALDEPELASLVTPAHIFRARPDLNCVMHFHSKATIVFSSLDCELLPVSQGGVMLHGKISYDQFNEDVWGEECNNAIVEGFRDNQVMLMRNHGALVGGRTVLQAFRLAYYLDQACAVQIEMMQTGQEIIAPSAEYAREAQVGYWANHGVSYDGTRDWPSLMRMLDAIDPNYRA
ncbi:MAG: class II aldolase/adducin family protein [Alphaproteobacteria bacterium]|nr:class II aldolase/adducin family protein [Alphaproteobacteria bacterium]MBU1515636.1 class II aldolase/adducin family protein [Alphaproteobacteria bacterium]MBU2094895.1 class II aldolase/adducin family protein [Alphaproteobacteria bacterium]MBU2150927.1 class II aldolase/adducin family protein [Alphaproteobacteria bacterium]MBU2305904.1 class II aldolase/adducin family protein [Alphaproteobacteria bacterium]